MFSKKSSWTKLHWEYTAMNIIYIYISVGYFGEKTVPLVRFPSKLWLFRELLCLCVLRERISLIIPVLTSQRLTDRVTSHVFVGCVSWVVRRQTLGCVLNKTLRNKILNYLVMLNRYIRTIQIFKKFCCWQNFFLWYRDKNASLRWIFSGLNGSCSQRFAETGRVLGRTQRKVSVESVTDFITTPHKNSCQHTKTRAHTHTM